MASANSVVSRSVLLCGLSLSFLSGCSAFQSACSTHWFESKPVAESAPSNVHVTSRWDNRVRTAQDTINLGGSHKGIAGRVYLMDDKGTVDANGSIAIAMLDITGATPVRVAEWRFQSDYLKQHKDKDGIGNGYTIFLPWVEYHPNVKKVKLLVAYLPKNGEPQLGDESILTLQTGDQSITTIQEKITPPGWTPPMPQSGQLPPGAIDAIRANMAQAQAPNNNQAIPLQQGVKVPVSITQQQSPGLPGALGQLQPGQTVVQYLPPPPGSPGAQQGPPVAFPPPSSSQPASGPIVMPRVEK